MSIWNFLGKVALFKLVWDFFFKSRTRYDDTRPDYYPNDGNVLNDASSFDINENPHWRHRDYNGYDDLDDDNLWQSDCYGSAHYDIDYDDRRNDDDDIDSLW